MMTLRSLAVLILAAALLLSAPRSHSSPLASCSNVGVSPGNYTIAGTTHRITSADSIADVNALSVSPGDAVLFEAGTTWNIGSEANRLKPKTGVLYGRYGAGANPVISGAGVSFGRNFRGTIDIVGVNNVTVDGIDVKFSASRHFGIYAENADNITVSRLTVSDQQAGGVIFESGTTNITAEFLEIARVNQVGNPHEALAFIGTDGYVARYNYIHHSGRAGINNKSNARNGELYGNEIHDIENDPSFYVERAENLDIHDNWVHDTSPTGTGKTMFGVNVEWYSPFDAAYNRNIEIYNNVIATGMGNGFRMWIKPEVAVAYSQLIHNVHFHHNTIVNINTTNQSWHYGIWSHDSRPSPDPSDWSSNVMENNIIWDTGNAHPIHYQAGTHVGFTGRNNLFETGAGGGSDLGSNSIFTSSEPFVDLAGKNFTPTGAALGAGSDGSDVGAKIDWSCGTSEPNIPIQPSSPIQPLPPILE